MYASTTDAFANNDNVVIYVKFDATKGKVTGESLVNGEINVRKGDTVKLTATPNSGYVLAGWEGIPASAGSNRGPEVSFVADTNRTVIAKFKAADNGGGGGGGNGGGGGEGGDPDPDGTGKKKSFDLKAALRKYWWVIAIIVAYYLYKEGEK